MFLRTRSRSGATTGGVAPLRFVRAARLLSWYSGGRRGRRGAASARGSKCARSDTLVGTIALAVPLAVTVPCPDGRSVAYEDAHAASAASEVRLVRTAGSHRCQPWCARGGTVATSSSSFVSLMYDTSGPSRGLSGAKSIQPFLRKRVSRLRAVKVSQSR